MDDFKRDFLEMILVLMICIGTFALVTCALFNEGADMKFPDNGMPEWTYAQD